MSKKQQSSERRAASLGIAICFLAAVIFAGTYAWRDFRGSKEEVPEVTSEADEPQREEEPAESASADKLIIDREKEEPEPDDKETAEEAESSVDSSVLNETAEISTAGTQRSVTFSEDSELLWPVNGQILLNYSMDKTTYFQTLDQYKYNPALIIGGAEGDQVISGAAGIVKSIDVTARTGMTVNLDLGGGYELFVGQLKDVPVNTGDYVDASTVIGYVSQPTKYYSVEGCNIYFEMRKDGQPVNPLDYISE